MFKIHGYNDYEDQFDVLFHLRRPTWQINSRWTRLVF